MPRPSPPPPPQISKCAVRCGAGGFGGRSILLVIVVDVGEEERVECGVRAWKKTIVSKI